VRFSAPPPRDLPLPTLEVLLVPEGPAEADNPRAGYIAQRSQHGSGTARDSRRTSLPESSASLIEHSGEAGGNSLEQDATTAPEGGIRLLTSSSPRSGRTVSGAKSEQAAAAIPLDARPIAQIGANASASDENLHLKGDPSLDDRLLADTRESLIAGYLDGWKRRIERVGTLNFPDEARRQALSGNPVLEVAIRADGRLDQVLVRRTSGHRELDNAALRIVRLAAPFDPFPRAMREQYPVLRFAYEWQFIKGRLGDGSVYTNGP
jgi:protein TonB